MKIYNTYFKIKKYNQESKNQYMTVHTSNSTKKMYYKIILKGFQGTNCPTNTVYKDCLMPYPATSFCI